MDIINSDIKFTFSTVTHDPPLMECEKKAFKVKERPPIDVWAEKNISLKKPAYTIAGPFNCRPWQREPLNCLQYWNNEIIVGSTQIGKSLIAELVMYYYMAVVAINGMVAYGTKDIVESAFKIRINQMIRENPVLCELWDGKEDNLTIENILLTTGLWRVASAANKDTMASFPAGFVYGAEVAKWQKPDKVAYNPVDMLKGRQGAIKNPYLLRYYQ